MDALTVLNNEYLNKSDNTMKLEDVEMFRATLLRQYQKGKPEPEPTVDKAECNYRVL